MILNFFPSNHYVNATVSPKKVCIFDKSQKNYITLGADHWTKFFAYNLTAGKMWNLEK